MPTPICPRCDRLSQLLTQRHLSGDRLAQTVRETYRRRFVRIGEQVPIDGDLLQRAIEGDVFLPDTLRGQIAHVLEVPAREVFPEYGIECQRLKAERTARGLTQAQLAAMVQGRGMTDKDISSLECGGRFAHPGARRAIAAAIGMSEAEFFPEFFEVVKRR
jgi:hypothetical protein